MNVLIIDRAGDGMLDIALRAQDAGHKIRYFLRDYDAKTRPIGGGLLPLIENWRTSMRWADLILLSANDLYMAEMDGWRDRGPYRIVGGGAESASWEIDRGKGMEVFKRAGIPVPPYRTFTSYDDAIAYVKRHDAAFAAKPSGSCDDKSLSYVAKGPEDMIWRLERWKAEKKRAGIEFMLQEKVEGIEFAVGGWWGPNGWLGAWEENFEFKKLMPGDLGPNTGETGTLMRFTKQSKLANRVLKPLERQLEEIGYVGCVDVNCIVDDRGTPWPLEFTMRFGWPAFNIQQELQDGDPVEWLADLCDGRDSWRPRLNECAAGVVMALPPFPHSHAQAPEVVGVPLYGLTEKIRPQVHPCDMMKGTKTELESAGPYVLIATGSGATVREATSSAYRTLAKLSMPASPFWRNDIGMSLKKKLPTLQALGYAPGWQWATASP